MSATPNVTPTRVTQLPSLIPLVGPMMELLKGRPWQTMLEWNQQHGAVLEVRMFGKRCYIVSDPGLIQRMMSTHMKNYPKATMGYEAFRPVLGKGLITASGDNWKRQRTALNRAFRSEILDDIVQISVQAADRLVDRVDGGTFDMSEAFRSLTLQVISQAVTSLPHEVCEGVFPRLFLPTVDEINKRIWAPYRSWMPTPTRARFNKAIAELDAFLEGVVAERWDAEEQPNHDPVDILDRIVSGFREDGLERDEAVLMLRDQMKTFIFAGHETTSMMLTWAVHELTMNPDLMAKVRAEADDVFANGTQPSTKELKRLKWTEAVLKEALRRYALVPVLSREVVEDDVWEGRKLEKGALVVISIIGAHNDASSWGDPQTFRPERFFEPLKVPWAYLPFARGPRNCVGENFAMVEGKLVLARLVQRLDMTAASPDQVIPEPRHVPTGPVGGLPVNGRKRASTPL